MVRMARNKIIMVRSGNTAFKIYTTKSVKNGREYTGYAFSDHSGGERKVWTFADLEEAKNKAKELAEAINAGETEIVRLRDWRYEWREANRAIQSTGLSISQVCRLVVDGIRILGNPDEFPLACQFWRQHRPDKPITPKPIKEAILEFLQDRKRRISFRRHKTESSYLNGFERAFGEKPLSEIAAAEVADFVNAQRWNPKTKNDFLSSLSLLFDEAQIRSWVGKDWNAAKQVKRFKEIRGPVEVFEPWEAKQILARLTIAAPELVPFFALWCFGGIRKEEIARMSWPQVNRGLVTGYIELPGRITKTGQPRTVPITANLAAWFKLHRKESGSVVPAHWLTPTRSAKDRLDEITRFIARKTGVIWRSNGPRHSFATYHFKLYKDPGEVTSVMGTSLEKFQKHYWNKARTVTEELAKEWFNIFPDATENLIPITSELPNPRSSDAIPDRGPVTEAVNCA